MSKNTGDGELRDDFYGRRKHMPEYKVWNQIKTRCYNKNIRSYKDYGGRGITVCDEWRKDFLAFYNHIGPKPQPYGDYSLDRIDNDGNYEPGNVRWATRYQQAKNRRLHKDNKSGASGITWSDKKNGWSVFDFRDDKCNYIGFYPLLGKAIDALVEYNVNHQLAQEANKARLDELEKIKPNLIGAAREYHEHDTVSINYEKGYATAQKYLQNRIQELTKEKESSDE